EAREKNLWQAPCSFCSAFALLRFRGTPGLAIAPLAPLSRFRVNPGPGPHPRRLLLLRAVVGVFAVFAFGLVLGEVDLAGELLAFAEDLEPGGRVDRALVLDRHEELFVDAEALLVELDLG